MQPLNDNGLSLALPSLNIPSILDGGLPNSFTQQAEGVQCEDYYEYDTVTPVNLATTPNQLSFQNKYTLQQKIGEGGNGTVYKCFHKKKQKIYAVKIMHIDEQKRSNLKKNFRIVRCLRHDNIVPYKALFLHRGENTCYLVMNYCEYPCIDRKALFQQQELKLITKQVLTVLKYFHRMNFWHRDIKPENILYDKKNKIVKVIDFGVGKRYQVQNGFNQGVHTITGTPNYRAPEMPTLNYNEKIDCWALGITLYQLVAHCKPFESFEQKSLIQFLKAQKLEFKQPLWSKFSEHLQDLIKRLLKISPQHRISAAQALKHPWLYQTDKKNKEIETNLLRVNKAEGKKWNYSERESSKDKIHFNSGYIKQNQDQPRKMTVNDGRPVFTSEFIDSEEEQVEYDDYI